MTIKVEVLLSRRDLILQVRMTAFLRHGMLFVPSFHSIRCRENWMAMWSLCSCLCILIQQRVLSSTGVLLHLYFHVFIFSFFHVLFHLSVAVLSKFPECNKLCNVLIVLELFLIINRGPESTQNKLTVALWAKGWGKSKLWDDSIT